MVTVVFKWAVKHIHGSKGIHQNKLIKLKSETSDRFLIIDNYKKKMATLRMRVVEQFICHQVGGVLFFLLLCLSVTVVHMFFRATRAMSKVMVKLRRYHSLDVKRREKKRIRGSDIVNWRSFRCWQTWNPTSDWRFGLMLLQNQNHHLKESMYLHRAVLNVDDMKFLFTLLTSGYPSTMTPDLWILRGSTYDGSTTGSAAKQQPPASVHVNHAEF